MTTLPRKTHGSQSARRYRQNPRKSTPLPGFRDLRPKVTTLPRKTHGSKSARRYRPCHSFATPESKSDDASTQNPRVQKRTPPPPEPSRGRPCQGFATLEAKSDNLSTQNPRVQKRAGLPPEPSPLACSAAWCALVGASLVCVGWCVGWCELVGVRWSGGAGGGASWLVYVGRWGRAGGGGRHNNSNIEIVARVIVLAIVIEAY